MNEEEIIEALRSMDSKRVEQLDENARNLFNAVMKIADKRDKVQNNWNELKKCIGEWILYHSVCEEDYKEFNVLEDVESKMQELEGNNE